MSTWPEPSCPAIEAFASARDARLVYIHSRWINVAAFHVHAGLPHTVRFLERVQAQIDHRLDVTRSRGHGHICPKTRIRREEAL